MTTQAGSACTAGRKYKIEPPTGRHRAPPPPPTPPTAAWWTVATAAAVLTLASVAAIGVDVAPDARASGVHGTTVAAVSSTTGGPLELPTIGAVGTTETPTEIALSRPRSVPGVSVHAQPTTTTAAGHSEAAQPAVTTSDSPTLAVTPPPQPVTTPQAATTTAPPAATTASATTEEPTVTTTAAITTRRTGRPR